MTTPIRVHEIDKVLSAPLTLAMAFDGNDQVPGQRGKFWLQRPPRWFSTNLGVHRAMLVDCSAISALHNSQPTIAQCTAGAAQILSTPAVQLCCDQPAESPYCCATRLLLLLAGLPENLATFDIKFGAGSTTISSDFDTNAIPTTSHLETEAETSKVVELVNNVVDSELETSSTSSSTTDSEADGDYVYEYVYYYYDEDGVNGTVVDAQVASSNVKVLGQNVTGVDIHTNTGNPPLTASQHTPYSQETRPPYMLPLLKTQMWRKWTETRNPKECQSLAFQSLPSPSASVLASFPLSAKSLPMGV